MHDPFAEVWDEINSVRGLLAPNQERCLFELVRRLPEDALIVEIGSFFGRSTVAMAAACRGTARRIIAVDTFRGNAGDFFNGKNDNVKWEGEDFFIVFMNNLRERKLERYVVPLRGVSRVIGGFWASPIDMIFIDGSHSYDDVMADLENFVPWVRQGGCIALHDVTEGWPEVYRVWHERVKPQLESCNNVGSLSFGYRPRGSQR